MVFGEWDLVGVWDWEKKGGKEGVGESFRESGRRQATDISYEHVRRAIFFLLFSLSTLFD